jgi:hypothetical protein
MHSMMEWLLQEGGREGVWEGLLMVMVNWALIHFGDPKIFYIVNIAWSFFSL